MLNNTLANRLISARKEKKWTQSQLAKNSKVTQQTISAIETGGTVTPLKIIAIAEALEVNPKWLLYGNGRPTLNLNWEDKQQIAMVSVISWEAAKHWDKAIEDVSMQISKIPFINSGYSSYFGLEIENDIMVSPSPGSSSSFFPGDIIIVSPDKPYKSGDFVIADVNGAITFKQYILDSGKEYLKPLNPQYPLYEMLSDDKIIGCLCQVVKIF